MMQIWIASARISAIQKVLWAPIEGIITNPTVLLQEGPDWCATIQALAHHDFGAAHPLRKVHLQAIGTTRDKILSEMEAFRELLAPRDLICKIPASPGGFAAIPELVRLGLVVNVTAICTLAQAQVAAQAGAAFLSVYVARINDYGEGGLSGFRLLEEVHSYVERLNLNVRVIAASVRDQQQYEEVLRCGVHGVAVSPNLLVEVVEHPLTTRSLDAFHREWDENAL